MSAAPSARPLAPAIYLQPRLLNERFYWWYQVLVAKIYRLCLDTLAPFNATAGGPGAAVKQSLEKWEEAFKVQFSHDWVALLNQQQLEDIYEELYHFAKYRHALNVQRSQGTRVATLAVAIQETVNALAPPLCSFRACSSTRLTAVYLCLWTLHSCP